MRQWVTRTAKVSSTTSNQASARARSPARSHALSIEQKTWPEMRLSS